MRLLPVLGPLRPASHLLQVLHTVLRRTGNNNTQTSTLDILQIPLMHRPLQGFQLSRMLLILVGVRIKMDLHPTDHILITRAHLR